MSLFKILCAIDTGQYVAVEFNDSLRLYDFPDNLILCLDEDELSSEVYCIVWSHDIDCDLVIYLE